MHGKFLHPWVGERGEDLILTVFLSPQPEALHVNLETGDQSLGLGWDTLALCITWHQTPDDLSQERDLECCCEMMTTQHCEVSKGMQCLNGDVTRRFPRCHPIVHTCDSVWEVGDDDSVSLWLKQPVAESTIEAGKLVVHGRLSSRARAPSVR